MIWNIQTRPVADRTLVEALSNELDLREVEAIALAVEIQADQVLIDERRGRLIANRLKLPVHRNFRNPGRSEKPRLDC